MRKEYQVDNNPVSQPPQPATTTEQVPNMTAPQQQQAVNTVQDPVSGEQPKSSKKMILMLILGLVIAVILVGGVYFYVNRSKQTQSQQTPSQQENLEAELEQVEIEDLEEEFSTVEADLQNL